MNICKMWKILPLFIFIIGCQTSADRQQKIAKGNNSELDLVPITKAGIYYDLKQHTNFTASTFNSFYISEDENILIFSAKIDSEYFHIYKKNPYNKTFTQITTGSSNNIFPSLSSDKKKMTFVSDRNGNPNIYVVDLDKTFLVAQITDDKVPKYLPKFSPDGTSILYTAKDNDKFTLVVVDLNTKIKTFLGEGVGFSWTKDYGVIFMKPHNNKSNAIWTINVEKLNISQIIYDTEKTIVFPSANYKGNIITYSKTKQEFNLKETLDSNITNVSELWISEINDIKKTEYQILNDGYTNFNPVMSGERIYFISDRNGTGNIWSLKVALDINK